MEAGVQRHPGVEYRVGPAGDSGGIGDRRVQQAVRIEFPRDLRRHQRVQPAGVLAEQIDLRRIGAELGGPFDPGEIADHKPAAGVLEPKAAAMVILIWP